MFVSWWQGPSIASLYPQEMAHLVKKNTTMSVTIAIPRAFSLSLQPQATPLSACIHIQPKMRSTDAGPKRGGSAHRALEATGARSQRRLRGGASGKHLKVLPPMTIGDCRTTKR